MWLSVLWRRWAEGMVSMGRGDGEYGQWGWWGEEKRSGRESVEDEWECECIYVMFYIKGVK
jgi:hypothetical protein